MLQKLAQKISKRWFGLGYINETSFEWCSYGLEIILSSLIGLTMVLVVGIISGEWLHALIFLAVFVPLRQFTGGYHADAYWKCHLALILVFLFNVLLIQILPSSWVWTLVGLVLFLGVTAIWGIGPIEHPNKPSLPGRWKKNWFIAKWLFAIEWVLALLIGLANEGISMMLASALLQVVLLMFIGKLHNMRRKTV